MATTRKRVLRGDLVTGAAKRRQRVQEPRDRAPKGIVVGAKPVRFGEGSTEVLKAVIED